MKDEAPEIQEIETDNKPHMIMIISSHRQPKMKKGEDGENLQKKIARKDASTLSS